MSLFYRACLGSLFIVRDSEGDFKVVPHGTYSGGKCRASAKFHGIHRVFESRLNLLAAARLALYPGELSDVILFPHGLTINSTDVVES